MRNRAIVLIAVVLGACSSSAPPAPPPPPVTTAAPPQSTILDTQKRALDKAHAVEPAVLDQKAQQDKQIDAQSQ